MQSRFSAMYRAVYRERWQTPSLLTMMMMLMMYLYLAYMCLTMYCFSVCILLYIVHILNFEHGNANAQMEKRKVMKFPFEPNIIRARCSGRPAIQHRCKWRKKEREREKTPSSTRTIPNMTHSDTPHADTRNGKQEPKSKAPQQRFRRFTNAIYISRTQIFIFIIFTFDFHAEEKHGISSPFRSSPSLRWPIAPSRPFSINIMRTLCVRSNLFTHFPKLKTTTTTKTNENVYIHTHTQPN